MTAAALIKANSIAIPLRDDSVDLIVTSPPYFSLRSYQDGGDHYAGQIGSEPTPADFLRALWAVTDECYRVLKPSGSCWINLGDKYAGSGGHNNAGISGGPSQLQGASQRRVPVSRRNAPDRYNQAADVLTKSLMGLPWRFALGLTCPDPYRRMYENNAGCWHDEPEGRCFACIPTHNQHVGRAEVVWSKPNGLPESVTDRVRRSHEQWFHLTKEPRYFSAVDEVREQSSDTNTSRKRAIKEWDGESADREAKRYEPRPNEIHHSGVPGVGSTFMGNPLGKLPGSVWSIPSEPLVVPEWLGVDHFAAFPQEWPRRIILGWSPGGICEACGQGRRPIVIRDLQRVNVSATITGYACACDDTSAPTNPAVVLDPFGGTGTVAMVARSLGRYGVNIDLSADYLRLAWWRIFESGHAAKTVAKTNGERQGLLEFGAA